MVLRAWYMDSSEADQREPHQLAPNQPVSAAHLDRLGVLSWSLDMAGPPDANATLNAIRKERGYSYMDIITISPEKLENYEGKLKIFFKEHLHTDEEIRLILEGTGYFDVRDVDERWIRIAMEAGDMIVLPAGMYHRFTLDASNYLKAMRLFVGDPVWTPHNRESEGVDEMAERLAYAAAIAATAAAPSAAAAAAPV